MDQSYRQGHETRHGQETHQRAGNNFAGGRSGDDGSLGSDEELALSQEDQAIEEATPDTEEEHAPDNNLADSSDSERDLFFAPDGRRTCCRFLWINGDILWVSSFNLRRANKLQYLREQLKNALSKAERCEKEILFPEAGKDIYIKAGLGYYLTPKDMQGFFGAEALYKKEDTDDGQEEEAEIEQTTDGEDKKEKDKKTFSMPYLNDTTICIANPNTDNSETEEFCLSLLRYNKGKSKPMLFERWCRLLCVADSKFREEVAGRTGTSEESYHWQAYKKLESEFINLQRVCGCVKAAIDTVDIKSFRNTKTEFKTTIKGL